MSGELTGSAQNRRQLLASGGALAIAACAPPATERGATADRRASAGPRLPVAATTQRLLGADQPATSLLGYGGSSPGPLLRSLQGQPFRMPVENRLDEDTTVHWHGVRVPNAMDGVPGLTQPAIRPGGEFTYAFTPPDAGTFWYHSHDHGLAQMGRGLVGAFIVDERSPPDVDRELVWVVQDWRLTDDGRIAGGFGNRMEAGMAGRVGNRITINGRVPGAVPVRAGERIRLRILNAAVARIMALSFEGHAPVVIARDGQPCEPHVLRDNVLLLGPAMRADLIVDMGGRPGGRYAITDDFYGRDLSFRLVELAYDKAAPVREHPKDTPVRLEPNPLPQPDLAAADRHELKLQGGMMGGMGMMGMGAGGASWAINGVSMSGDGAPNMPPAFTIARGRTCVLALNNETSWWHPMHLHGHSFRVLSRNGAPASGAVWGDTVLVAPRETVDIAFVADNPGDWMLHCHVMDHQSAGMMTMLRVA